jgi:glycerate dehydrogenase
MKIVFLDTKTLGNVPNLRVLEQYGEVVYHQVTRPDQTLERVKDADIVITNKVVLDKQTIEQADHLKLI